MAASDRSGALSGWPLQTRLIVFGLVAVLVVTTLGGLVLRRELHEVMQRSQAQALRQRVDRLAAELPSAAARGVALDGVPAGAEFDTIFSGWYWQLGSGPEAPRSRSLWDAGLALDVAQPEPGPAGLSRTRGPRGEALLGVAASLSLGSGAAGVPLHVYGPAGDHDRALARIDHGLLGTQALLVLAFVLATVLQVRLGLAPMRRLQAALAAARSGTAERLGEGYGRDLAPLAQEIDAMLLRNARIVERARHHAADLGHALKKPLALLGAQAQGPTVSSEAVRVQIAAISALIDRHLVRSASGAGQARWCEVEAVLAPVLRLVQRLHAERGLRWSVDIAPALRWQGEPADLEEIAGNLLDNAGKWARSAVTVRVTREPAGLVLRIDDDGPGLDAGQRAALPRRGMRFDEGVDGSGLGLAIVDDLAQTYGGALALDAAPLGGLRCTVTL